jgi:TolB-like protein
VGFETTKAVLMEYGPYSHFTQPNKTIGVVWDVIDVLQQISNLIVIYFEMSFSLARHRSKLQSHSLRRQSQGIARG